MIIVYRYRCFDDMTLVFEICCRSFLITLPSLVVYRPTLVISRPNLFCFLFAFDYPFFYLHESVFSYFHFLLQIQGGNVVIRLNLYTNVVTIMLSYSRSGLNITLTFTGYFHDKYPDRVWAKRLTDAPPIICNSFYNHSFSFCRSHCFINGKLYFIAQLPLLQLF